MSDLTDKNIDSVVKFEELLNALDVKPRLKRLSDFEASYDMIEERLAKGIPLKAIIDAFNKAYGHNVYPNQFRAMLKKKRAALHGASDSTELEDHDEVKANV